MIVYLDNDALVKLFTWGLLHAALSVVGATVDDVQILPTARFKMPPLVRKKPKLYGDDTAARLESFIGCLREVNSESPSYERLLSHSLPGIDPGEAQLIACVIDSTEPCLLLTGDKNCLRALSSPGLSDVALQMKERVVSIEAAVLGIIRAGTVPFAEVRRQVVPWRDCDTATKAAFGSGEKAEELNVTECLQRYVDELPDDLLIPSLRSPPSP